MKKFRCQTEHEHIDFGGLVEENSTFENKENIRSFDYLACCGWSYKTQKDVLSCSKCLRSIGLWLFKRENADQSDDEQARPYLGNEEMEEKFQIEFSEEYAVINNIINLIEIEDQTSNVPRAPANYNVALKSKKRKLNQQSIETYTYPTEETKSSMKLFDPINEHFNWCPWRREIINSNINTCQANFNIINKYVKKLKYKNKTVDASLASGNALDGSHFLIQSQLSNEELVLKSKCLLEKVRTAQSLLINCASQFSLK